jgi:glucose dehydrogenase
MVVAAGSASAGPVTTDDLLKAQDNGKEWLTYGRDYRNWRYSPLTEITPENASKI